MLGISTCWWHGKGADPHKIIEDVKEFGIRGIELEYRIPECFYRELKRLISNDLNILSIHNFFPRPDNIEKGSGDLFLLSSLDPDERSRAVNYTQRTIREAQDSGAKAVVVHLGYVDMPHQREFFPPDESRNNLRVTDDMRKMRMERYQKSLDAVLLSLDRINEEAVKRDILIGIENRYYYHEIPDKKELGIIFDKFHGGNIGYWHDVGHAHAQMAMGILNDDLEILREYHQHLVGVHLHDAIGTKDHQSPGEGDVEFKNLKTYLFSNNIIKILEIHPWVKRKKVGNGIRFLESMGIT